MSARKPTDSASSDTCDIKSVAHLTARGVYLLEVDLDLELVPMMYKVTMESYMPKGCTADDRKRVMEATMLTYHAMRMKPALYDEPDFNVEMGTDNKDLREAILRAGLRYAKTSPPKDKLAHCGTWISEMAGLVKLSNEDTRSTQRLAQDTLRQTLKSEKTTKTAGGGGGGDDTPSGLNRLFLELMRRQAHSEQDASKSNEESDADLFGICPINPLSHTTSTVCIKVVVMETTRT
jgi:hypothetical protein